MSKSIYYVGDVFVTGSQPTVTYVAPHFLNMIRVLLAKTGSILVIEGPSGIGKTTAVKSAIQDLKQRGGRPYLEHPVQELSGRLEQDVRRLLHTPINEMKGVYILDDYHRIWPPEKRDELTNKFKSFADSNNANAKLVIVGVRRANRDLVRANPDVSNRLDAVPALRAENRDIAALIEKGEEALNIKFSDQLKASIIESSRGSFYLAQSMCFQACAMSSVIDTHDGQSPLFIDCNFDTLRTYVIDELDRKYKADLRKFCKGQQGRYSFKAPYLRLIEWIRDYGPWEVDLRQAMQRHPEVGRNVHDIICKQSFRDWCSSISTIRDQIYIDTTAMEAFVENPDLAFYISEHSPEKFRRQMGLDFKLSPRKYQVAISYASEDYDHASSLYRELTKAEIEVFFDSETVDALEGEVLIDKIKSIYSSEADIVVPIIGKAYRNKFWTYIEEQAWRPLIDGGRVYPIFVGSPPADYGGRIAGSVISDKSTADEWATRATERIEAMLARI